MSILFLVFWTTVGDQLYFNEMLIFVRMPAFFFVSGLFAHRVITRPALGPFLRDKIGNLVYLYALWIAILFLGRDVAAHLWYGRAIDPMRQLEIFWNPLFTIWFLYALAFAFLVARLLRTAPVWLVFAAALGLYCVVVGVGEWRDQPFLDRVARLFPFFWLGLVAMPVARPLVERHYRLWPLATAVFLALAYALFDSPLSGWGVATFPVSLIGIAAMLLLARWLADFEWSWLLERIGASTLFIYVMHRLVLWWMDHGLRFLDLDFPGIDAAKVIPIVAICVVFGHWAQRTPWAAWLFAAPWTLKPRAPEPAPPVRAAARSVPRGARPLATDRGA